LSEWIQARDFAGKRVTVMGLGAFGGQIGAIRFLVARGAEVLVTDLKTEADLGPSVEALAGLPVRYRLGDHRLEDFQDTDLVLASPAVPGRSEFLQAARATDVPVESEMGLFVRYCPAEIVGVTGTNGKSTTTALLGDMVRHDARRVWVGGNIGGSVLEIVDQIDDRDLVVLELSSFQLEGLDALRRSPHLAVVTNFSENHLDHHAGVAEYRTAKQTILRHQTASDFAVLNYDDPDVREWHTCTRGSTFCFSVRERLDHGAYLDGDALVCHLPGSREMLLPRAELQPLGAHNVANALAALTAAVLAGATRDSIGQGYRDFRGLEHRLELVCERDDVRYYNDSKCTTPAAGIIGIEAFADLPPRRLVVIAGGYDKHVPLDEFAGACAQRAKHVVLLGAVRPQLSRSILLCRGDAAEPVVTEAETFEEALSQARSAAVAGDVVLLSPACASYGMFNNYEERGTEFKRLVKATARS